ncbi:MAG: cytochrome c maturation protein CcmE [Dehalococcoidia bacterium]|nr:MAG: cytochrome c maturation protein CcmE [Dehalococcoidia bacterium]
MVRTRYLVGGALILAAIGFLLYSGLREGSIYYYTVTELKEDSASLSGKEIRVAGQVADGSVDWELDTQTLRFTLVDQGESLPVVYHGVVPDTFQAGREVVVCGKYDQDGVFLADDILAKCPSKYVPRE